MLLSHLDLLATAPGGVARLRELILTLAVRGKLVPQDPADAPASVLLQKIRAEKDQLIAEGKIKRDKLLAEVAEEEKPFELPLGWEWSRLGALASKLTDGSHNPPRDSGTGYPMLSSQNVWEGGIIDFTSPTRYVDKSDFLVENKRTTATPGDILLTIVASLGRSAVVPNGAPAFVLQRSVAVIRSGLNPNFLSLYLRAPIARAYYNLHGKGTAQKGIYLGKLGAMLIAVPPLAEQSRIVARVEELMRLCDALEAKGQLEAKQHAQLVSALLGTLTASTTPEALAENWQRVTQHFDLLLDRPEAVDMLEQAILEWAVRGLLVPQDPADEPAGVLLTRIRAEKDRLISEGKIKRDKPLPPVTDEEKPFELPTGWEWVKWANIAMKIGDIDHKMPPEAKDGVPYVSPRDFHGINEIDFDGAKKITYNDYFELASKIRPTVGDLIYPRYGTIGVVRKVNADREFLASYYCAIIKVLPGFIDPDYQYLFSISGCTKAQATSATNKTTQPNVGLKSIQEFLVPLPPLAEQSRIITRVTELRRLCADLRLRLSSAQATQTHLAQALLESATSV